MAYRPLEPKVTTKCDLPVETFDVVILNLPTGGGMDAPLAWRVPAAQR